MIFLIPVVKHPFPLRYLSNRSRFYLSDFRAACNGEREELSLAMIKAFKSAVTMRNRKKDA